MPKKPKFAKQSFPPGAAGSAGASPTFAGASDRDLANAMMAQAAPQPNVTPEPHPSVKARTPFKRKVSQAVKKPSIKIKKV
jgi:hypothetical protein